MIIRSSVSILSGLMTAVQAGQSTCEGNDWRKWKDLGLDRKEQLKGND
jgi:hypothetical protein